MNAATNFIADATTNSIANATANFMTDIVTDADTRQK
jgi:hypothetical protein